MNHKQLMTWMSRPEVRPGTSMTVDMEIHQVAQFLQKVSEEMRNCCKMITAEQLAYAKDLDVYCRHACPEYGIYLFVIDCSLDGERLKDLILGDSSCAMVLSMGGVKDATRIAREGVLSTQKLAQQYLNGERLQENAGIEIETIH